MDKTWAYLKELNSCIEYYPTGTGPVMKELGEGSRDITLTMTGWGHQPARAGDRAQVVQGGAVQGHDLDQRCALHGDPEGRGAREGRGGARSHGVSAHLPEAQAYTYDKGYFYPGPRSRT